MYIVKYIGMKFLSTNATFKYERNEESSDCYFPSDSFVEDINVNSAHIQIH